MKPQDSIHGGRVRWPDGLGAFDDYRAVWFEITKSEHGHGGPGWAYGRYLWCPVRNRGGARYRRIMEEPRPGDLVIHIYDHWWPDGKKGKRLHGASLVASRVQVIDEEPPEPGEWGGMAPYYRIALRDFREFDNPVSLPEFVADYGEWVISEIVMGSPPQYYPFLDPGTGEPRLIQGLYLARCTEDLFQRIKQAIEGSRRPRSESTVDKPLNIEPDRRGWTMDDLQRSTLWDNDRLEEIVEAITTSGSQIVLAGPPGTGKSHTARHLALFLTAGDRQLHQVVQLHPHYGYQDLMQGFGLQATENGLVFEPRDGIVMRMAREARANPDKLHVLVLDDMSRADILNVFGELLYLLDYRDEEVTLPYSGERFSLPENLRFIGTVNSADMNIRSVYPALRRRFDIFECPPDPTILAHFYAAGSRRNLVPGLVEGFIKLNEALKERLDRHHLVGHTFFMVDPMTPQRLEAVWTRKVLPLIEEYFFHERDTVKTFKLEAFWPEAKGRRVR